MPLSIRLEKGMLVMTAYIIFLLFGCVAVDSRWYLDIARNKLGKDSRYLQLSFCLYSVFAALHMYLFLKAHQC